jgi:hypothetical protein
MMSGIGLGLGAKVYRMCVACSMAIHELLRFINAILDR